ncbi:MAG: ethanolamine ammonia-lyase reactivating factor EutA [Candidatus Thorarchaeota archaeon]
MTIRTERQELTSVGVDIGSSTSHIVFSKITLEKDSHSRTDKFEIVDREIIHSGPIHLTPFRDPKNIDFEALKEMLLADYEKAGIRASEIDTGAVIITGETARKENAEWIVSALAGETGKFVAATAGPNFESVLAAYGSGAVSLSEESGLTIMNIDIGGGSSNVAVCSKGSVIATTAINVGGRLIAYDDEGRITRLEDTGQKVAETLGVQLRVGDRIDEKTRELIADSLADALIECIRGKPESDIAAMLMMAPPLRLESPPDRITLSGGVAEYFYGVEKKMFNDLGVYLADALRSKATQLEVPFEKPEHRIRATVIGAGSFSLRVSGSTTFLSEGLDYPIRNVPVVSPNITRNKTASDDIRSAIEEALSRFDLVEGRDPLILSFVDAVRPSYERLTEFCKGVVSALPNTIRNNKPIMMCFDTDIGNSVGNIMRRETKIQNDILSIDEVSLREGDFVDIGRPIIEDVVVPVIVKTLVFDSS